jgi:hypothetical protein
MFAANTLWYSRRLKAFQNRLAHLLQNTKYLKNHTFGTGVVQFISEQPYAIRVISSLYKAVVRRLLTVFSLKSPECLIIALNLARYLLGIEGA